MFDKSINALYLRSEFSHNLIDFFDAVEPEHQDPEEEGVEHRRDRGAPQAEEPHESRRQGDVDEEGGHVRPLRVAREPLRHGGGGDQAGVRGARASDRLLVDDARGRLGAEVVVDLRAAREVRELSLVGGPSHVEFGNVGIAAGVITRSSYLASLAAFHVSFGGFPTLTTGWSPVGPALARAGLVEKCHCELGLFVGDLDEKYGSRYLEPCRQLYW